MKTIVRLNNILVDGILVNSQLKQITLLTAKVLRSSLSSLFEFKVHHNDY